MIEVKNVRHHYGVRPVLQDVSLRVERGEIVALMGPNGMGKSTLMGIIAGAIAPTRGEVWIDGKRRRGSEADELAIRRKTVWLPAEPWLPAGGTGREFLLGVGRVWGVEWERLMTHADALLDLFELKDKGDSPVSSYSTGQKKKIALAGALVTEASVMVLDEPFSGGLDPSGILALKRVLLHYIDRGEKTILMATPVPELVEEMVTGRGRVAIIVGGRLVAHDTVANLRSATPGAQGQRFEEVYAAMVNPTAAAAVSKYLEELK